MYSNLLIIEDIDIHLDNYDTRMVKCSQLLAVHSWRRGVVVSGVRQ